MKLSTVKNSLREIARLYPTLAGLLVKPIALDDGSSTTVGDLWAKQLVDLDLDHFANVIDEFASLRVSLPDQPDRLPAIIKQECLRRMAADQEAWESHQVRQAARHPQPDFMRRDSTGVITVKLGRMVREGRLSKAENDAKMDELLKYDRGETIAPDWLEECFREPAPAS